MPRKKNEPVKLSSEEVQDLAGGWYTAGEAAKKLTETSKRQVGPSYVSKLGSLGKLRTKKLHDRLTLYYGPDVDAYKVEPRGKRSGAAMRARHGKTGPTAREERAAKKAEEAA